MISTSFSTIFSLGCVGFFMWRKLLIRVVREIRINILIVLIGVAVGIMK